MTDDKTIALISRRILFTEPISTQEIVNLKIVKENQNSELYRVACYFVEIFYNTEYVDIQHEKDTYMPTYSIYIMHTNISKLAGRIGSCSFELGTNSPTFFNSSK